VRKWVTNEYPCPGGPFWASLNGCNPDSTGAIFCPTETERLDIKCLTNPNDGDEAARSEIGMRSGTAGAASASKRRVALNG
jgi:hypothetical protein